VFILGTHTRSQPATVATNKSYDTRVNYNSVPFIWRKANEAKNMRLFDIFNSNTDRNEDAENCKGKVVLVHIIKEYGGVEV